MKKVTLMTLIEQIYTDLVIYVVRFNSYSS